MTPGSGHGGGPHQERQGWLSKLVGAEKYEAIAERGLEYADLSLAEMKRHHAEVERLLGEILDALKAKVP